MRRSSLISPAVAPGRLRQCGALTGEQPSLSRGAAPADAQPSAGQSVVLQDIGGNFGNEP